MSLHDYDSIPTKKISDFAVLVATLFMDLGANKTEPKHKHEVKLSSCTYRYLVGGFRSSLYEDTMYFSYPSTFPSCLPFLIAGSQKKVCVTIYFICININSERLTLVYSDVVRIKQ